MIILVNTYLAIKKRREINNLAPIITLNEKGIDYEGVLYEWQRITRWEVKRVGKNSAGHMHIYYSGADEKEVIVDMNGLTTDYISLMLMLTHFKAKYG